MKSFPLFLCGVLLVCSADVFAQDAQKPRIHPRLPRVEAGATAAIDYQGEAPGVSSTRPLRGSLFGFQSEYILRAIVPFLGALDKESTDRALGTRHYLVPSSEQ